MTLFVRLSWGMDLSAALLADVLTDLISRKLLSPLLGSAFPLLKRMEMAVMAS